SYKMKNYSDKKFKILLLESLSALFNMPKERLEKKLINFKVMNWIKEPHILGGYSFSTLKTEEARRFLHHPYENTFYFAGEYISKNSTSTVEAALISGKEVAGQILKSLKK
ncbi:MAG: FAD-dependent oxidoreductase, partial [Ginsengibacter sp.]